MKLQVSCLMVVLLSLVLPTTAQDVRGGGTTNYIPIWTNSTTLGDSTIFETHGMGVRFGINLVGSVAVSAQKGCS